MSEGTRSTYDEIVVKNGQLNALIDKLTTEKFSYMARSYRQGMTIKKMREVIAALRVDLQRVTDERDALKKEIGWAIDRVSLIAMSPDEVASKEASNIQGSLCSALAAVKPEKKFIEVGRCNSCGCAIDKDGHGHHSGADCKYVRDIEQKEV